MNKNSISVQSATQSRAQKSTRTASHLKHLNHDFRITMDYFNFSFGPGDLYPWHFDTPIAKDGKDVSIWAFSMGKRYAGPHDLKTRVTHEGTKTSVVFAEFGIIFIEEKLGHALAESIKSLVQLIPVEVIGTNMKFVILNLLDEIECVDEANSEFTKYEPGNQMRPDKVGHYRSVYTHIWGQVFYYHISQKY